MVGGGGLCGGGCAVNHLDAEMYSPGYLFNADGSPAPRPTITLSGGAVGALLSLSVSSVLQAGRDFQYWSLKIRAGNSEIFSMRGYLAVERCLSLMSMVPMIAGAPTPWG